MERLKDNVSKIGTPQNVISVTLSDAASFGIQTKLPKWSSLERFVLLYFIFVPISISYLANFTYSRLW